MKLNKFDILIYFVNLKNDNRLIDTSYTIFCRFHATKRHYSAHPKIHLNQISGLRNEIFRKMFIKNFFEQFKNRKKT